jgi:uncharacterized protein DUF4126
MDLGTPLGLALASGINAYLPLLSFAIAARFFHLGKVNPQFAFITQNWFITALVILTLIDFVADKVPVIDHVWDAMHTVIRPIAGALVAAASYSQFYLPGIKISGSSSQVDQAMLTSASHMAGTMATVSNTLPALGPGLLIILILGALLAFVSHTAKATTRLLSTLTTAGLLNLGLSLTEDILVLLMVLLSLLVPIVMLVLIGLFLIVVGPSLVRVWSNRLRKRRSFL